MCQEVRNPKEAYLQSFGLMPRSISDSISKSTVCDTLILYGKGRKKMMTKKTMSNFMCFSVPENVISKSSSLFCLCDPNALSSLYATHSQLP